MLRFPILLKAMKDWACNASSPVCNNNNNMSCLYAERLHIKRLVGMHHKFMFPTPSPIGNVVHFDESPEEFAQLVNDRIATLQTEDDHGYMDGGNVIKQMMHLKVRYGQIYETRKRKDVNVVDLLRQEIEAIVFSPPTSPCCNLAFTHDACGVICCTVCGCSFCVLCSRIDTDNQRLHAHLEMCPYNRMFNDDAGMRLFPSEKLKYFCNFIHPGGVIDRLLAYILTPRPDVAMILSVQKAKKKENELISDILQDLDLTGGVALEGRGPSVNDIDLWHSLTESQMFGSCVVYNGCRIRMYAPE